ncbi:MAG: hypothetical protein LBS18_01390 [Clostridiales bacterium]|nr:hypothetical protein [Clostridiales bacterium]
MRNKGITIELTALLDVILIIVFVILAQTGDKLNELNAAAEAQTAAWRTANAKLSALRRENERLLDENRAFLRMETGRAALEENSLVLTISVREDAGARGILMEADEERLPAIGLDWQNREYAADALCAALRAQIEKSDAQVVLIVFLYDRNKIYQADYVLVANAVQSQKHLAHVYAAEYDSQ